MHDSIIIGSGLAGSSMACALAQCGWDVLLIERQKKAQHKVCGEFLSPEAQHSLKALGLYVAVAALGPVAITQASLSTGRGTYLRLPLHGSAWGISRYALDAALLDAAEAMGVTIQRGASVTNLQVSAERSLVHIRQPTQQTSAQARISIIACGRNPLAALRPSIAATQARLMDAGPGYVGVKCHYSGIAMPAICELFLFKHGYIGVLPTEMGTVNACMLISKAAFSQAGATVVGALQFAIQANPALARRLEPGMALSETAVAVAPVDTERPVTAWGPTARIGDAVCMIPPLCGDGMAMALRSAQLAAPLADAVLRGELPWSIWASAHTSSWQREFMARIRVGRVLQRLLMHPALADPLLILGKILPAAAGQMVKMTRG